MEAIHIQQQLERFHGTEFYHRHFLSNKVSILLTDGTAFLREKAECHWLFDFIAAYQTHQNIKGKRFQVWTLEKQNLAWEISCEDGNHERLYTRRIEFSDIPLEKIIVWFVNGVAMLPSEY